MTLFPKSARCARLGFSFTLGQREPQARRLTPPHSTATLPPRAARAPRNPRSITRLMNSRLIFALALVCQFLASPPSARGQVYEKVFDFGQARAAKGAYPTSELVQGNDGNFYGTTPFGGAFGYGTVFKMTPAGVLTTLVEFRGDPDGREDFDLTLGRKNLGAYPFGGLVLGGDGNFYGTTTGSALPFGIDEVEFPDFNGGTIFKVTPDGQLTTLWQFRSAAHPCSKLLLASDGNFYGTTWDGGEANAGFIFKMTPAGALTTLVEFTGQNGKESFSALVEGADGSFYGTTFQGGAGDGGGTVFKVTLSGELTTLVNFGLLLDAEGQLAGEFPFGALVLHSDGNFYGTTEGGGPSGAGTVFKMTPTGVYTTVIRFGAPGIHGSIPHGTLVEGADGNLYGTTFDGGEVGVGGSLFKVTPSGVLTTFADFTDGGKRGSNIAGLVQGSDGNFYGMKNVGGSFSDGDSGALGTALGTVFKMTPSGAVTTLVEFAGKGFSNLGRYPLGALVQGSDGNYYGTTYYGGPPDESGGTYGTVFKLTPTGEYTTLVEFAGGSKGVGPGGAMIQGTDGYLYGTTIYGGSNGEGTIFRMSLSGELATLVALSRNDNGWHFTTNGSGGRKRPCQRPNVGRLKNLRRAAQRAARKNSHRRHTRIFASRRRIRFEATPSDGKLNWRVRGAPRPESRWSRIIAISESRHFAEPTPTRAR